MAAGMEAGTVDGVIPTAPGETAIVVTGGSSPKTVASQNLMPTFE